MIIKMMEDGVIDAEPIATLVIPLDDVVDGFRQVGERTTLGMVVKFEN
jgi:threonine dehydrogenase-like Zn-dependent dehydrogenase